MSDKPDAIVNANDVPFGHGLKLQDLLEIGAFLEMLSTAPMSEISEPAARFQTTLVQAAKKCMAAFVAKNYPDAHAAVLVADDKTDAAKDSLDEIIKKGSK